MLVIFLLISEELYCSQCGVKHMYANNTCRCCDFTCQGYRREIYRVLQDDCFVDL